MTWNHAKKTPEEISTFRALAEEHTTEFLSCLLAYADSSVPEYVEVIREILSKREEGGA